MNEENIREVIAFPKNGSGVDVMMSSPSPIDENLLKELNIQISETE
jgi:aspartyl-tRNA synthetase